MAYPKPIVFPTLFANAVVPSVVFASLTVIVSSSLVAGLKHREIDMGDRGHQGGEDTERLAALCLTKLGNAS